MRRSQQALDWWPMTVVPITVECHSQELVVLVLNCADAAQSSAAERGQENAEGESRKAEVRAVTKSCDRASLLRVSLSPTSDQVMWTMALRPILAKLAVIRADSASTHFALHAADQATDVQCWHGSTFPKHSRHCESALLSLGQLP
jgi:hypothetical protein